MRPQSCPAAEPCPRFGLTIAQPKMSLPSFFITIFHRFLGCLSLSLYLLYVREILNFWSVFTWFLLIDCHAIGMEDHNITESQITASSLQNGATNARLNFKPTNLLATGAWCAAPDDTSQPWLQIDFQDKVTLSQVAIQGRFYDGSAVSSSFFHWVEKYSLNYSLDGMYFKAYKQFDDVKVSSLLISNILLFLSLLFEVQVSCYPNCKLFQNMNS